MQCLPYKDFKWIKVTDKHINKVLNKKDTSLHGYILEVDIYLPDELHNKFSNISKKINSYKGHAITTTNR